MTNLETLSAKELKGMARDLEISGWWNMKKVELINAINNHDGQVKLIVPEAPEKEEVIEDVVTSENTEVVSEVSETKKRKNQKRMLEYNGKTQTLTAWAKELGIRHQTLYNRIVMKGWDVEKAFGKEVHANAEEIETE